MDNKKKVLFVATVVKSHINVFHLPYIKWFKENGYETHVCAKDDFDGEECIIPNCDVHHNIPFERSPINKMNFKAYKQLKKIIEENKYDIIHCNTPVASILTRLAAIKARKNGTKVIYTAHGFHFFKGAPLMNWILYYPAEKICSYFTDVLITINNEDYELANKKMKAKKIYHVHGVGIDTKKFSDIKVDIEDKRKELGVPIDAKVILSVGELSKRKNHEVVINALAKLNDKNLHYCIVGRGELNYHLEEQAKKLGISENTHILGFRNDIDEICKVSDLFCFPSKQEGLPVALMEAMATGLPVVCSNVRGNNDLIKHGIGGYLCNSGDVNMFKDSIKKMFDDMEFTEKSSNNNIKYAKKFDINNVKKHMEMIYKEVSNE